MKSFCLASYLIIGSHLWLAGLTGVKSCLVMLALLMTVRHSPDRACPVYYSSSSVTLRNTSYIF